MGPWRALMGRARGRPRYFPSSASSSSSAAFSLTLTKAEQHQPCPLAPNGRFVTSHDACPRLSERIWPGLGLDFAQKNGRENVEDLLEDAKDFLLDSSVKECLGRPDLGFPEGFLKFFEQKKTWLAARASPAEFAAGTLSFKQPWLNAGSSAKQNAPRHAEDASLRLSMCDSVIQDPGFCGLQDTVIHADSVKRKRKKKMNKHKHRKLRRLARKSHK